MITILHQRLLKKILKLRMKISSPTEKKSIYYFAYGANINQSYFSSHGMSFEKIGIGVLKDYKFSFSLPCEYKEKGFGGVNFSKGSEVYGVLYKLTPSSLRFLDILEWLPFSFYRREELPILVHSEVVRAEVYLPNFPDFTLYPSVGYKNLILNAARELNFPESYVNSIANAETKDSFEINHEFNLRHPGKPRLLPNIFRKKHDSFREKLANFL